jgi:hypothetical protein
MKIIVKYSLLFIFIYPSLFQSTKAQAFEPRFLSDTPIKANFLVGGYAFSKGDILLDIASPVQDLESSLNTLMLVYGRSFKLFNRLTKIDVILPYAIADFNGLLNGVAASTSRNGFGDPLLRISMIIIGVEALELKDFIKHQPKKFKFGVGIRITPPLGQYDSAKLINLGSNRWTFKLGVGASYTFINKIILETQIKYWVFTQNDEFFNGGVLRQTPLISAQFHLSYIFKPGVWISGSIGQTNAGITYINEVEQEKTNKNARFGATFSYRVNKNNSLKIALTNGIPNQYAIDYTSIILAYSFLWFDKK